MNRREFLSLAGVRPAPAARGGGLLMLSAEDAGRMRAAVRHGDPAAAVFRDLAADALQKGPWTVTAHRPRNAPPGLGPNDYYSEGPYWWPDPGNPKGPYIRKDGQRYPGRFQDNRRDLGAMCESVLALGLGAYFLGDGRCTDHAERVLRSWFLDARTRMAPHLEFGQAVIGRNTGRGTGQIETVGLIQAGQGLLLLEQAKLHPSVTAGVRRWYGEYLKWMTTAPKGIAEQNARNNHATWWTAQVAAFGTCARDEAARNMAWSRYRDYLVPKQVRPDGSCPAEEARTRSLSYSSMNLDGFSVICRQAQVSGLDLWRYRTAEGAGVERSFRYLLPYVAHPRTWKKPQITEYEQGAVIFPGLAGLGLRAADLLAAYRALPRNRSAWVQMIDLLVRTRS